METRPEYSTPPMSFNTVLEVLANAIRKDKSKYTEKEEIKLSLFTNNMII